MEKIDQAAVARVARIYHSNQAAAEALGIQRTSFSRLCREYGIETPYKRRQRQQQEARARAAGGG